MALFVPPEAAFAVVDHAVAVEVTLPEDGVKLQLFPKLLPEQLATVHVMAATAGPASSHSPRQISMETNDFLLGILRAPGQFRASLYTYTLAMVAVRAYV